MNVSVCPLTLWEDLLRPVGGQSARGEVWGEWDDGVLI